MKLRSSLFTKIMLWVFLNLLILGAILFLIFNLSFRFDPNLPLFGGASNRIEAVMRSISDEVNEKTREERDQILSKYSETYRVEFFLFDNQARQLAGRQINLPPEIAREITEREGASLPPPPFSRERPQPPNAGRPPRLPPPIYARTENPTTYWFGQRTMTFDRGSEPFKTRILAASDSFYGYGLFFDPKPWIFIAAVIFVVSVLFWLPFVRSMTRTVAQMTDAAEKIAEENFDVRVDEKRTDELGRLGKSVNHLAKRLSGFVHGQKRFLGDISHELNSPLARMQFALSILEDRVDENNRVYVEDVKEEVELMSKLVSELLTYSKAGIKSRAINLEKVRLLPLVKNVLKRETTNESVQVETQIELDLTVAAQSELLTRAFANVVRNAVRYAGHQGAIRIEAEKVREQVIVRIADSGKGVPESEIEKLFDPFHRVETDRARQTGGSGLGLAIVKTCIEACGGVVSAHNLKPTGFEIVFRLNAEANAQTARQES